MINRLFKNKKAKVFLAIALLLLSQAAFCASGEPFSPFLQKLLDLLTGTVGTSIAVLGIGGAAIGAIFGRLDLMKFLMVFAGIAALFGSANLVEYFR